MSNSIRVNPLEALADAQKQPVGQRGADNSPAASVLSGMIITNAERFRAAQSPATASTEIKYDPDKLTGGGIDRYLD